MPVLFRTPEGSSVHVGLHAHDVDVRPLDARDANRLAGHPEVLQPPTSNQTQSLTIRADFKLVKVTGY
ncbi:MAG: hypothetical protein CL479_04695 [Acidobacteria bacterium]|nr:hypothetical protein [Acidobacteriota bacterium]